MKPTAMHASSQSQQLAQLTSIVLLVANLIPLAGVLFYGWDLQSIMLLYWLENLIVGLMNIVRILFIAQSNSFIERVFTAAFFSFHYGFFCLAHGALLFDLLDIEFEGIAGLSPIDMIKDWPLILAFLQQSLSNTGAIALLSMLVSHAFSLQTHYFKGGEMHRVTVSAAMSMPYRRIVIMHIGLIAGAFLIQTFGATIVLLLALIGVKIIADVILHRREHQRLAIDSELGT